jgi:hypothetical protein
MKSKRRHNKSHEKAIELAKKKTGVTLDQLTEALGRGPSGKGPLSRVLKRLKEDGVLTKKGDAFFLRDPKEKAPVTKEASPKVGKSKKKVGRPKRKLQVAKVPPGWKPSKMKEIAKLLREIADLIEGLEK